MAREMVTLQLRRDGRPIGPECSAHLDWRSDGRELRRYLADAVEREHIHQSRIGEFVMDVYEVGAGRTGRWLTTFVAAEERR